MSNPYSLKKTKPKSKKTIRQWVNQLVVLVNMVLIFKGIFEFSDPVVSGIETPYASVLYKTWRPLIDMVYSVSKPLLYPVDLLIQVLTTTIPAVKNDYFPIMEAGVIGKMLQDMVAPIPLQINYLEIMRNNAPQLWMPGQLIWSTWISVLFYQFCLPVVEFLVDSIKNLTLFLYTEYLYNHKKDHDYKKVLIEKNKVIEQNENDKARLQKEDTQLREALIKDVLTNTYNRRFYAEKIRELFNIAKTQKQIMTVIMVDIDHFKAVNDTYGHQMGDEVLTTIANVLKKLTPKQGFCCRYGGEEFSILLPNTSAEQAMRLSELIRLEVMRTRFPSLLELKATVSLGVATGDFSKRTANENLPHYEDLVHVADDKLYEAKTNGRNQVCHTAF
jgi:diguanylate cyclase (GGDEF)-like protein